jgi:molecular chaperone GrpE
MMQDDANERASEPEPSLPGTDRAAETATESIPSSPQVERRVATSVLSEAIAALQEAQKNTHERLLRTAAEFENFKKRSRKESVEGARRAEDKVVLEFLPVLDNLTRALTHAEPSQEGLLEGVRMVQRQFVAALERFEIKPFASQGQPFNPERHEAIQQVCSETPAGVICQELQVGYCRGERLLRPALVIVSIGREAAPRADTPPGDVSTGNS